MVTFRTHSHGDVSMFTSDAHTMLKLMGLSTTVPSALRANDVPAALERLEKAIETREAIPREPEDAEEDEDEDREPPVPLRTRALPLMQLLKAAADANEHVIWE